FARVFKAEHRIEESIKRAKGEAGLADYQVRTWEGWHHHQALSLVATWFLTQETRLGKKTDPRADRPATAGDDCRAAEFPTQSLSPGSRSPHRPAPIAAQRASKALPLETTQPLAASTV